MGKRTPVEEKLSEREKELDAVYKLAALFSRPADTELPTIRETADILGTSLQFPHATGVEITTNEQHVRQVPEGEEVDVHRATRTYADHYRLELAVGYFAPAPPQMPVAASGARAQRTHSAHLRPGAPPAGADHVKLRLDERERNLVDTTATFLANVLERIATNRLLRESSAAVEAQAKQLERKNVALEEVLDRIESERHAAITDARDRLHTFVEPLLHDLAGRENLTDHDRRTVRRLIEELTTIFSGGSDRLNGLAAVLSPRETEICSLIRGGMSSKQIAEYLTITSSTVERHRNTIRHKLGLAGTGENLTSWLRQA